MTNALYALKKWFMQEEGYKNTLQYNLIMKSYGGLTEKEGQSIAMRILIHLVADIH